MKRYGAYASFAEMEANSGVQGCAQRPSSGDRRRRVFSVDADQEIIGCATFEKEKPLTTPVQ
jgi:hypothetical protein